MVCNYDGIKKLELDVGTMQSLFSWEAIERELQARRFMELRETLAGDWSNQSPDTKLSSNVMSHYKFNRDGTYSFDSVATILKSRFAIDGRGNYRAINTGIELRDTFVSSNGSPGTLTTRTANYDRANDTLTLAGVIYQRGILNGPRLNEPATVDATVGTQDQRPQQPSTTLTSLLAQIAVAGVWFRERADLSTFERLTITIRPDGTYTKESLLRMSVYGGGYIPGKHDGTWRADGMVVSLSGDGNYPGSTHDLRTFTRLR